MLESFFLASLAALFSLDVTAFGQLMISRPIVCAPVFGYILGDMKSGLWVGMIIESLWTSVIPMGAAIPHDTTAIAVITVLWGAQIKNYGNYHHAAFITALFFAVPAGILFRTLDVLVRTLNVRLVHWVEEGVKKGLEERIQYGVYAGAALFYVKAFLFYFILIYAGKWFMNGIFTALPQFILPGLNIAWWLLPVAGLSVMLVSFNNKFPNIKN